MTRDALLIAHGQPSDPAGPEAELAALAQAVAAHLPGWRVRGVTLAEPGALEAALAALDAPLLFPFFMSDGWFLRRALPDRLAAAGRAGLPLLPPFGLLEGTRALARRALDRALADRGWRPSETRLVCLAHGSGRSPRPAETARALAAEIGAGFAETRTGFVEQAPRLAAALAGAGPRAICLPLFVARWGHMQTDVPAALAASGFSGVVLPPLGTTEGVPGLIAETLLAQGR